MRKLLVLTMMASLPAFAQDKPGPFDGRPLALTVWVVVVLLALCVGQLALVGLIAVWRPGRLRASGTMLRQHPIRCLLAGVVSLLIVISAVAIIAQLPESIAGIPLLVVIFGVAYFVAMGMAILVCDLGERILSSLQLRHQGSAFAAVLVGGALFLAVGLIPGIGQLLHLVLLLIGLGAAVMPAPRLTPETATEATETSDSFVADRGDSEH